MSKKRSFPGPEFAWHFDCRLEAELPEDNVVGSRFLINLLFGSIAVMFLLLGGWLGYRDIILRLEMREWEALISEKAASTKEVKQQQIDYSVEATKIDQAYAIMKSQLYISGFSASVARVRPAEMVIDRIESGDNVVYVRGSIDQDYLTASTIFDEYVKKLKEDPDLVAHFDPIRPSSLDQSRIATRKQNFEITFYRKPSP